MSIRKSVKTGEFFVILSNTKRIQCAMTPEKAGKILDFLEDEFRKDSGSVEKNAGRIVNDLSVIKVKATLGSICRKDKTRIVIMEREQKDGYIIYADTKYSPSFAFWILLIALICLYPCALWLPALGFIPIIFYLCHQKIVNEAIKRKLSNAKNKFTE